MAVYDEDHKGYRVFIGDLGTKVFKYELQKEFEYYGDVKDVWLARNPPGFAFVVFKFEDDANNAVRKLNGRIVCRRRVRVEHALPYGEKRFPNREPARRSSWSTPARPTYRSRSPRERRWDRSHSRCWSGDSRRRQRSYSRSVSRDRRRRSLSRSRSHSRQRSVERRSHLSTSSRRSSSTTSRKRRGSSRSRSRSQPLVKSKTSMRRGSRSKLRGGPRDRSRSPSRRRSEKVSPKKEVNGQCCDNECGTSERKKSSVEEAGNHNSSQSEAMSQSPGGVKKEEVGSVVDAVEELSTGGQGREGDSLENGHGKGTDSQCSDDNKLNVVKAEVLQRNDLEDVVNGCIIVVQGQVKSELGEAVKSEEKRSKGADEDEDVADGKGIQSDVASTNAETCQM